MEQHLLELLSRYGAPVLFGAQVMGIIGLPIPDELLLMIAGALVRDGRLHPVATAAAAMGGCMSGITVSYALGRTAGAATLRRVVHVPEPALERGQQWFRRFGGWLLMFGYFIPGVRHVTAIAAGSAPLDYEIFAAFAYPGAALWSTVFLSVGYVAGDRWRDVGLTIRHHSAVSATILLLAIAAGLLVLRYRAGASGRTT